MSIQAWQEEVFQVVGALELVLKLLQVMAFQCHNREHKYLLHKDRLALMNLQASNHIHMHYVRLDQGI